MMKITIKRIRSVYVSKPFLYPFLLYFVFAQILIGFFSAIVSRQVVGGDFGVIVNEFKANLILICLTLIYVKAVRISSILSFRQRVYVFIFLSLFVIISILFLFLIGYYSPLTFFGSFLYFGIFDGMWILTSVVHAFELYGDYLAGVQNA